MFNAVDANIMIDGWTMAERQIIQSELMKLSIGQVKLDDELHLSCLSLSGEIGTKQTTGIAARCYVTMKVLRLVILEPSYEHVETEYVDAVVEKKWFRRSVTVKPASRIVHTTIRTVPRSAWRVRSIFIGADASFPTERSLSGDLFTSNGNFGVSTNFGGVINCGIDATICVENTTDRTLPFNAVLLGTTKPFKVAQEDAKP